MNPIQKFTSCGKPALRSYRCDDSILELLQCPICFEVPSAEIFQCKNGHAICDRCLASIQVCPQCRTPIPIYGELIRARALESVLDSIMVPCPYQSGGCTEKFSRKEVKNHVINCVHNGKIFQLCKHLGYHCDFWTNTMNSKSAVDHFHLNHKAITVHGDGAIMKIDNLKTVSDDMGTDAVWTPSIFELSGGNHLMIVTVLNYGDKSFSWICLKLNQNELPRSTQQSFEVEFRISSQSKKLPMLKWKIPTISVLDAPEVLKLPMSRFPIQGLAENYVGKLDGALRIAVSVHNNRNGNEDIGNFSLEIGSFTIGEIHPRNENVGIRRGEAYPFQLGRNSHNRMV